MLDIKDKKIVAELCVNSRIPISVLAKRVGVSREVALYRMNRLKKELILGFYTVIDYDVLGFKRNICFMQLKGITAENEEEFLKKLAGHEFITYLGSVVGKWNAVFDIITKDEVHLKGIVKEFTELAGPYLESYIINSLGVEEEIYPTKYVDVMPRAVNKGSKSSYTIDNIDKKILRELTVNSRIEYSELSKKLRLAANTIKYRIKNMEKSGVIKGYTLSIDYRKLGFTFYNLQIKLHNYVDTKLISYIKNHKRTIFYYKYLGNENWDIDIGVILKDYVEFRKFIIELKNSFGEQIKIHDIYLISEAIKDNIAPEGVFR